MAKLREGTGDTEYGDTDTVRKGVRESGVLG